MTIRNTLAVAIITLVSINVAVAAETGTKKKEGPCVEDVKKYCSSVKAGDGRIASCLHGRKADLTPACSDAMAAARQKMEKLAKECKADAEKYCKDVPKGHGRVLSCLKGQESKLSAECGSELKQTRKDKSVTQ